MKNTEEIWSLVDAKERPFSQLSDRVWEMPELCYGEFRSCAEHTANTGAAGISSNKGCRGNPDGIVRLPVADA
jgi:aminobenzoyl-glutamate utilization protein B